MNYAFLEYSYNPVLDANAGYENIMQNMGFTKISAGLKTEASFYQNNKAIMLCTNSITPSESRVTSIGFVCEEFNVYSKFSFDDKLGMFYTHDPAGLKILIFPASNITDTVSASYFKPVPIKNTKSILSGIKYVSGVVYQGVTPEILSFYESLGFKTTTAGDTYTIMVSKNRRFSIIFKNSSDIHGISDIIYDCEDIFHTTSYFTLKGYNFKKYTGTYADLSKLNYKISAYNCIAQGNSESYSIENYMIEPMINLNFIFRERKQYLHFKEKTLNIHFQETELADI